MTDIDINSAVATALGLWEKPDHNYQEARGITRVAGEPIMTDAKLKELTEKGGGRVSSSITS